jgi:purine-binding chemotaxis protein CheW
MESEPMQTLAGQVVVFSFGGEDYGLPIGQVQEIIRHTRPRSIASVVPWVLGVINLRGRIVPVCDLGVRFGIGGGAGPAVAAGPGEDAKIVIVESASGVAGIVVADVSEVLTLAESEVEPLPAAGGDCRRGIAKVGERLIALLDPDLLLSGVAGAA